MKTSDWFIEETKLDKDGEPFYDTIYIAKDIDDCVAKFKSMLPTKRTLGVWSQDYAGTAQGFCPFISTRNGQLRQSGLAAITQVFC